MKGILAVAAVALALPVAGCSSAPPSWCRPTVRAIESNATIGGFEHKMQVLHDADGAPTGTLGHDQYLFLVSPSGLGTGGDYGPAWRRVVSDLKPIASACHEPLAHLEAGLG
jgi:hypothetical protein